MMYCYFPIFLKISENIFTKKSGLDLVLFVTIPSHSWAVTFKKTKRELELLAGINYL